MDIAEMPPLNLKDFTKLGKKIIGAGLNYRSVVIERKLNPPKQPVVFLKPSTSYIKEGQCIEIPKGFEVHHEVELGVIIGKQCKNIRPEDVNCYIAGYCLALDLTAVDQMKEARANGLPWTIGKSFDTACPVSEAIGKECIKDPNDVHLWLKVNGSSRQECSTSDMIFSTQELISFISLYMTLEPYDLILTGSPAGTGPICSGDTVTAGLDEQISISFNVK